MTMLSWSTGNICTHKKGENNMQINIENGKRFNEEPAIAAVSSGNDIVLVRLADGTGV